MRVTQSMLTNNMLRNLTSSYHKLGKYQEQLSSQKKISRPSDDPVVVFKGISYRTSVNDVSQYQRNMSEVNVWLENTEDALEKAGSSIHRLTDLVTQANTGTVTDDDRKKIEDEIEEIKKQLVSIANTKISGKYIFNGSDIYNAPVNYDGTNVTMKYNNDAVNIEVSAGIKLQVNYLGSNVFGDEKSGMFADLEALQNDLKNGNDPDLGKFIDAFQSHLNTVTSARSSIGASMNRVDMIQNRLDSQEIIATKTMSENEDIDVEKVILNLQTQQSIHRAALSVGSSIIQPSLVDFLR
ncbi:flagellar hook-associated protein FlgL [Cytobacillus solani]|uniref:Flagellar biosynthesis protein FlgL n=1 Tax=Cytobacillus solani TaxID=1637975 RepID=A0A0Q3QUA2_9BACI|nr:flagellar hook-associated protein FlgL [Cytobacillus solani]KOP72004.1 flagellar biosynthesis protein FlgL [Bacillus sp. FJAT-21945]KQL21334.1 flagellar biosynthesis protein FlgL [Cytobacillus solani]USK54623.1 flagellar hook-associated protein FlgL [Cytobacillus solani]